MRVLALAIFAIAAASASAQAQTYDPNYPVCLHVYGRVSYYECRYTSLPQCNAFGLGPLGAVRGQSLFRAGFRATCIAPVQAPSRTTERRRIR